MAKLFGEIAAKSILTLDKSFARANGQPLDSSEIYYSKAAAEAYAKTDIAYIGQKIVVIENNKVTHYSIEDAAGTLKEVGSKPIGDGKSITVDADGIVGILGAADADSLTLPRMKEDKSGIEWVPVSQVVQGDGNDNTTYEVTPLKNENEETYGIKVKTLFNGTAVEDGEFEIPFDVYTKGEANTKFYTYAEDIPGPDSNPLAIHTCPTAVMRLWATGDTPDSASEVSSFVLYVLQVDALPEKGLSFLPDNKAAFYIYQLVADVGTTKYYIYSSDSDEWDEFIYTTPFVSFTELINGGIETYRIQLISDFTSMQHTYLGTDLGWAPVGFAGANSEADTFLRFAEREYTYTKDEINTLAAELPKGVVADDKILTINEDKLISAIVALDYDADTKTIKLTGKDGADLGSVDATPFIKDGMLNDVTYDANTNTLTFKWNTDAGITEDTVVLSDIIEPYTAGNGLALDGNEFSVKVADGNESFLTVDENGVKLSGVASAIATAKGEAISDAEGKIATAKQEAITAAAGDATTKANQALADAKADAASIYATKAYVGTIPNGEDGNPKAANVVAYIEAKAAEVLSQATGGSSESAASVKGQLDTFKAEINPKVERNTEDIATINEKLKDVEANADVNIIETVKVNGAALTPDENKAVDITVPTKFSEITDDSGFDARITAAQNQADKGVNDASAAQTTANEAKGAAETNATAIGTLNTTVAGHTTTIGEHTTKIGNLENFQNEHTAAYNTLNGIVSGHTTSIAGKAEQTALDAAVADIAKNTTAIKTLNETTIPGINEEVGKKANSADVYSKTAMDAIIGTPTEGKTIVQMIEAAQTAATYDDTQVKADIKANTDAIAKLNGDDKTEGSVDYKVAQEVAKIVNDNNDGNINTLNEIAAWIVSDTTGAAKMNADIAANTAAITKLNGGADVEGSVLAMIAANAPKVATDTLLGLVMGSSAENKVSVAVDGTMEVNSLNVNKLVQTSGEFLILNGGSANA